jgi:threonine/homoserine/homoserine lactone efflux protein
VLSSSLVDGRRAGFAAVGGMVAGGAAHTVLGAAGAGLLFALLPGLFQAVLLAGALYVAWLGWGLWRSPATLSAVPEAESRSLRRTFLRAAATCLMNPKAYLFMAGSLRAQVALARGVAALLIATAAWAVWQGLVR